MHKTELLGVTSLIFVATFLRLFNNYVLHVSFSFVMRFFVVQFFLNDLTSLVTSFFLNDVFSIDFKIVF